MTLTPADLNDLDTAILEYLSTEGRASPTLFIRAEGIDTSRQWVSSRFVRLAEHGHIRELYDTGIYEFVDDPQDNAEN
jgi:DNA-binding Lrp family transcriptional regulator